VWLWLWLDDRRSKVRRIPLTGDQASAERVHEDEGHAFCDSLREFVFEVWRGQTLV
jgi:hypothetical protein